MLTFVSLVILVLIVLISISLKKIYKNMPAHELKRRAQGGDSLAKLLHRAAAYGASLTILLWLIIGLSSAGFFVLLCNSVPAWAAFLISLLLLWVAFAWLPKTRVTKASEYLARALTPLVAWLLRQFQPLLSRIELFIHDHFRLNVHTGIYEKEDLLQLLKNQKGQLDNRLTKQELQITKGALTFSDKLVRDVMTPRGQIKMVKADDAIGPVLLSELHDSGHSRFPVYADKQDNLVGILYLHDLLDVQDGRSVRQLMKKRLYYVNEELQLDHVLQAIIKTKHQLFVVVNSFEEVVGVISIEDILEQIIGQPIMDEFDKYEDLREVAHLVAAEDAKSRSDAVEPASEEKPQDDKLKPESEKTKLKEK